MGEGAESGEFGRLLRRYRTIAGLTQEDLAMRSGLSARAVSNIERGRTGRPYAHSVRLLADALMLDEAARVQLMMAWRDGTDEDAAPGPEAGHGGQRQPLVVPRQLPVSMRNFAGRAAELITLTGMLDYIDDGTALVAVIGGMAGVGKTALAVRWAHQAAGRFPDGQLCADLRGFSPSDSPVRPADALCDFLEALGVPAGEVPERLEARAGLYRSLLAGRRMLVLLDNASSADQVRPLLPASPGCLALVTSRSQLTGLAVAEGACLVSLDVLTGAEARELLALRLGTERLEAEQQAVGELIRLTAGLPLALALVAARAAAHPACPLGELAAELRDARDRLHALDAGDPSADVRAAFSWSCRRLSGPAARMSRLLSIHPGPDITVVAMASLAGVPPREARRALAELAAGGLLTEPAPGRYTCHDLVRDYAAEQSREHDSADERLQALIRLLDYYLHTARAAAGVLQPEPGQPPLGAASPGVDQEDVPTQARALAWFAAERPVLLALTATAADAGAHVHAWLLPTAMAPYLSRSGHWHEWAATQHTALAAARELCDLRAQALVHSCLGHALIRLRQLEDADAHLQRAIHLFRIRGDPAGQAYTYLIAAEVPAHQERHSEALRLARRALQLFRQADDKSGQARALNAVGWDHIHLGDHEQGLRLCQQALQLCHETGSTALAGAIWDSLGLAHDRLGQHAEAITSYRQAIGEYQRIGNRRGEADTLTRLGDAQRTQGDATAAAHSWRQALDILLDLHHPDTAAVRSRLGFRPSGDV
jgi:tetratricopeptide (TPR) repeat protein/transcriptional regulator with XRE-family HTH domain